MEPGSLPLPGLEHLLFVLRSHDEAISLRPPPAAPPRAGDLVLGEPFDPMLAELYSRFDGGRLGELYISSFNLHRDSLVPLNQRLRERAEVRVRKLLCYGEIGGLAEDFATVPSLANGGGTQPVVYFQGHLDKVVMPLASNVDRAFELYATHCQAWIHGYGSLDAVPPLDRPFPLFPRSYVTEIARDGPLVCLLADGRFDDLVLPDEASREWVQSILAAAQELH